MSKFIRPLTLLYNKVFLPDSRISFIALLKENSKVLDIGCGSHSPQRYKAINPKIEYYGIDIHEFNLDENDYKVAKEIIFALPSDFDLAIASLGSNFDAVISSHNIEHTNNPTEVIKSMLFCLKKGGLLYMVFPSEHSVNFPSRFGTLNFYDDNTHQKLPIFDYMCKDIENNGGVVLKKIKQYKPTVPYWIGFLLEPLSRVRNKVLTGTWSYYGFESIIIAKKK
jgi:ubiquinone/menaquinone biosynthesis C-methylase UbiE